MSIILRSTRFAKELSNSSGKDSAYLSANSESEASYEQIRADLIFTELSY
ncbi:uncharacterized protein PHALS_03416 [Plasmopara halstedii]|uniref:Uncharacterized protein n=1 Tax=Plasmopara halstedii TaxID=4781 RepID=A0A0P1AWC8_PLAHL|nr:uncharacterized protein PHALS_04500 [Plasmopara halstedii]XP_024583101.1 uncharacterized protein PHALS_03416 [Plasmopara halstedii]CEG37036.1 hypothetical protein PHALS_04500 [Plasmopara halstedii]CEG46732.1 hypothetical protein PHALS_03416 [Plasmopara halstedii]|eukprot:XP_024573405.1 hypothetical protein PHALS_04500 [Plasmopara halstedii]